MQATKPSATPARAARMEPSAEEAAAGADESSRGGGGDNDIGGGGEARRAGEGGGNGDGGGLAGWWCDSAPSALWCASGFSEWCASVSFAVVAATRASRATARWCGLICQRAARTPVLLLPAGFALVGRESVGRLPYIAWDACPDARDAAPLPPAHISVGHLGDGAVGMRGAWGAKTESPQPGPVRCDAGCSSGLAQPPRAAPLQRPMTK